MTTPINLTQLRKQAELNASEAPRQMLIDRDTVAALIDTAEAARDLSLAAVEHISPPDGCLVGRDDIDRLRETLNHYTTNP
jgi:hypothetical protein